VGIAIAGMGVIGLLQVPQLERLKVKSQTASAEAIQREAAAEGVRLRLLKNVPAFGFENLVADWTFLRFLQYFGDEPARKKSDYRLSPDFFEVILDRDPYFLQAYIFLSTSSALYAGQPERSVAIAQSALTSLKPDVPPGSFYAWRQLAIDQLLFLGDAQAARQSFETAATWAEQSTVEGGDRIAAMSRQTAAFLARNPSSKTAQVAAWAMVLSNVSDKLTRDTAIQRIKALGGDVVLQPDGSFSIKTPAKD
jgi:hypothetical protein